MPSRRSSTAALLAAFCVASMLAPGALAARPGPSIRSVNVYGAGFDSEVGLCNFNAVVTYKHKLAAGDRLFIVLRRDGQNINSNLTFVEETTREPLTIGLSTGSLSPASTYEFVVSIEDPTTTPLSSVTTTRLVSAGGCPAAGTLVASYPVT